MPQEARKTSSPRDARERLLLKQLRGALARARLAAKIAGVGSWEWDTDTDEVHFSPEWKMQIGYDKKTLPDSIDEWRTRLHPDERAQVEKQLRAFSRSPIPDFEIEYRLRHRNGRYRWVAARCALVDAKCRRIVITHVDITDKHTATDRLRYVAGHDGLTGLPNRRLLYEYAEHMVASARRSHTRLAVLFIDLDKFKPINDTYGHRVGDSVLKEAARRIGQSVRGEDMVGRIGGDEFVALLTKIGHNRDVSAAARHTLENLASPYKVDDLELRVPASIGISVFPRDGECIESLIEHADEAMYHAKDKTADKLQFYVPGADREQQEDSEIAERIREDLARGGFQLLYQPVLECDSNRILSLDAQLRWPGTGFLPSMFIPIAESTGQILALGDWTIHQAGRQWRRWHRQGLPSMPISVKTSPIQLFSKGFPHRVAKALVAEGAPPESLRLEVGEDTLIRSENEVARVLGELKEEGIGVEIKEFGHGYSCLEKLSRLPIAAIKINTAHCGEGLSEALFMLGNRLGCEVVGCHVESAAMLNLLKHQHYRRVQGFHLCAPLGQDAVATWHRAHIPAP